MNITFLLNVQINSKQLMIFTINANVLSSKKLFMNIRFLKNSLINTDIFNFSNVLFFLTQIYLPLMKSTRKLIIAKKANIYLPALRFKIYILYQNVCCQSGGQSWICLFHVKHHMDFSTNYPCPSITHGKITLVEQKLKLSVLLAKEDYQFGKHNRSSVWVSTEFIFC